ncbi:isoprenylcysteine carboxylmethyltransferase family protein [Oleomonas cavernae]|uniref:Isoprenylcysteine carboxylmethyltransferase family protein n=1 Tax=Oleomonas cavernae TaxID=2320859 RepID=A0A418WJ58_9PROT|nr:isoprenylcysteine carboxylmethyltransferase family protein [Oleomonas cavernae]RJF90035.1 isoprenylcysteine carboxylmethyltransferase family protein [Oleomonas cavernae]
MHLPQHILLVVACVIFVGFTVGYVVLFRRPEGTPWPMRVVAVLSGIVTGVHIAEITDERASWGSFIAALVLYAISAALYLWAVSTTRRQRLSVAFSADQPQFLLTAGPYNFVRHPFYTAYLLYWIAGVIAAKELWLIPTVILMGACFAAAALREEAKFADSPLGADYSAYRRRAGMFLPRLFRPA